MPLRKTRQHKHHKANFKRIKGEKRPKGQRTCQKSEKGGTKKRKIDIGGEVEGKEGEISD